MNVMNFNDLEYGPYIMDSELMGSLNEALNFVKSDFVKIYTQRILMPTAHDNVVYVLAKDLNSALNTTRKFQLPATYRKFWYPVWVGGRFMNKRVSYSISDRKSRDSIVTNKTNLVPYAVKTLPKTSNDNWVISLDPLYSAVEPVLQKSNPSYVVDNFWPEFTGRIKSFGLNINPKGEDVQSHHRILVIDCESFAFKMGSTLKDAKCNPLFIIYWKFLRNKDLTSMDTDVDMMICSKNLFLKFNPAKTTAEQLSVFRRALFRIMDANLDDYAERLKDEEKAQMKEGAADKIVSNVVKNVVDPYVTNVSGSTKQVLTDAVERKVKEKAIEKLAIDTEIKQATDRDVVDTTDKPSVFHSNPVKAPLDVDTVKYLKGLATYSALTTDTNIEYDDTDLDEYEDEIADDTMEVLDDDDVKDEVLEDIQDKVVPLHTPSAPVNTERDKKLREQQKKVVVKDSTIEQILERDTSNVPIEEDDKSAVMHTSNENMKKVKFANFDKTYIKNLYMRDILACFDFLKDVESPFYVTGVDIKDASDPLNYIDTWTVSMVDETGQKVKPIVVDIPKFQNDRFMYLNGSRFFILKQNFYNPLVKDTPDTVMVTTNFNKIQINRTSTKSLTDIERIFSLVKKTKDTKIFTPGDSSKANMRYIPSLEYDELSKRIFKYTTDTCELFFSRDYIAENYPAETQSAKGNEFYIGHENGHPVYIDEDTGMDRQGRTIIQIIYENLPDNYKKEFDSLRGPKQTMYVEGKLAGQTIPIIATLIVWNGIRKTLDLMGIRWEFHENTSRVGNDGMHHLRFADGVLSYEPKIFAELILNGMFKMHPERFKFTDFDSEVGYEEFIYSQWGSYNGINEVMHFKQFLVDPITKQVCNDMMLPDTPSGLLIHAVKLLSDNAYVSKASDTSYRVRSIEIIPGILYSCLAAQYKSYIKSGRRIPMTLNQHCVISKLMDGKSGAGKQVEAYSTLNPILELARVNDISTKGYKGSNSERAYNNKEKRSYDPTAIGKLAISTSPDAKVGVNKVLVVEPTITNARGYREDVPQDELKDVNIFSPVEMLTPGTARSDDSIRVAISREGLLSPLNHLNCRELLRA